MPEATFVFETPDGSLFAVLPDAVPREDHGIAAQATEQEVELGIAVTDHVREEADRFSAEIVISDAPIRDIVGNPDHFFFGVTGSSRPLSLSAPDGPIVERLASAGPPARGIETASGATALPTASTFQPDGEVTRTVDNWTVLRNAKAGAWLATITTDLHTYRSMLLLSAEVTLTADDAKWIRVEVIFRALRQVATQLVEAAVPLRPRNEAQANDGSQASTEEDPELESGAHRALGAVRGFLGI